MTHYGFYTAHAELARRGIGKALFEIHDEVLAVAKDGHEAEVGEVLKKSMVAATIPAGITLPLLVDVSPPRSRWEK